MNDIRQCWAFHRDGARCEHPAGHPGNHIVTKEWTDLECATPGEFDLTPTVVPAVVPAAPLVEAPSKCVACSHSHRGGECKCGCHSHIG